MTTFNTYANIGSPTVKNNVTISEWFSNIKDTSYPEQIKVARMLKQSYVLTSDESIKDAYDTIKESLPTITYNSLFSNYRSSDNFISSTGLMYIDVDVPEFDIAVLDKNKIFAYYKSIGGLGYSILVQVEGLNKDNYSSTFKSVTKDLNLSYVLDKGAKGLIQQSVISYDPNIFINYNSFSYSSVSSSNEEINDFTPNHPYIKKTEHIGYHGGKTEIRYTNIKDFEYSGDYIYNWNEGYQFVKCFMPTNKLNDGRKRVMLNYTRNLIYLNQYIDFNHALSIIQNVNERICRIPLDYKILTGILKSIFQQKESNKLIPKVTIRRILFNPDCKMDTEDKLAICGKLIKDKFRFEGCVRINEIIESWNFIDEGKITQMNIAKHGINIKTVEKYYSEFKQQVSELNALNKEDIQIYKLNKRNK